MMEFTSWITTCRLGGCGVIEMSEWISVDDSIRAIMCKITEGILWGF